MSIFSAKSIQEAYLDWMSSLDVESAIAGTLTFKRRTNGSPISEAVASDAVRVFSRMLQHRAYGNRFKQGKAALTFVAVNEGGREPGDKHPHVHFFAEVPDEWSIDEWIDAVNGIIKKIDAFGSEHCLVTPVVSAGWLDYMFKRRDKRSYADSVDIMSMWTRVDQST